MIKRDIFDSYTDVVDSLFNKCNISERIANTPIRVSGLVLNSFDFMIFFKDFLRFPKCLKVYTTNQINRCTLCCTAITPTTKNTFIISMAKNNVIGNTENIVIVITCIYYICMR